MSTINEHAKAIKDLEDHLKKYSCVLLEGFIDEEVLREKEHQLPTDTHFVRFINGDDREEEMMAIRAFRMSDIFDAIQDAGHYTQEICQGYGTIRPNLFTGVEA